MRAAKCRCRAARCRTEVSEILFDENGDMLVAERGAPTGAYDYKALAEVARDRVLRFRPKTPDDPPSRDLWFPVPKEYAIGFPPTLRNDNGGIAIGYSYDPAGNINRAVCGGTLWSTGEQLRNARDRAIIQRLQAGGPLIVDGLQGNRRRLLRPLNEPPFETYFIDYDDRFDDPQTRGTMGDVVIWRVCGQAALPLVPVVPVVLICPLGLFNVDGVCRFPPDLSRGHGIFQRLLYLSRLPGKLRSHQRKVRAAADELQFTTRHISDGRCQAPTCPAGLVPVKRSASRNGLPTTTNAQLPRPPDAPQRESDCGPGEVFTNDHCQPGPPVRQPPNMCRGGTYCACPDGSKPNADGTCKQSNGCGPHMEVGDGTCLCQAGYQDFTDSNGQRTCIPVSQCDTLAVQCCPASWHWNSTTHSCDPDNRNPTPKLKVTKTFSHCCSLPSDGGSPITSCSFAITIQNIGTVPYPAGSISVRDVEPNSVPPLDFSDPVPVPVGDLQPGEHEADWCVWWYHSQILAGHKILELHRYRHAAAQHVCVARPGYFLRERSRSCHVASLLPCD